MKTYKILMENLLLVEGKLDDIKKKYDKIFTSHDPYGKIQSNIEDKDRLSGEDKDRLIDHIHSYIPEGNTKLLDWAIDKYNKGQYKQEDLPILGRHLAIFNRYKDQLDKRQIKHYDSVSDLYDSVGHLDNDGDIRTEQEKNHVISKGSTLIHNSPKLKIYKLHGAEDEGETEDKKNGREACKILGSSSWCISSKTDNLFGSERHGYNKPTYIIHLPNEKKIRKIGYGIGTDQFQDQGNETVESSDIKNIIKRTPELGSIPDFQGKHWDLTDDKNKHWDELEKHINPNDNYNMEGVNDDVKSKFNKLKEDFNISESSNNADELHKLRTHQNIHVLKNIANNPNTKSYTLNYIAKNNTNSLLLRNISRHPNTSSDTLDHMAKNNENRVIRFNISKHPNASSDTLDYLKDDEDTSVKNNVSKHPNTSSKTLDYMKDDKDDKDGVFIRYNVAEHRNSSSDTLDYMAKNDKMGFVKYNVVNNPNTSSETLHYLKNDKDDTIRLHVAKHPNTSSNTLHHLLNDVDDDVRLYVANHPNTSSETLRHLRNDIDPMVSDAARSRMGKTNNILGRIKNIFRKPK